MTGQLITLLTFLLHFLYLKNMYRLSRGCITCAGFVYLLDSSLEALSECSASGQTAVVRSPPNKHRLLQVEIHVQVLTGQQEHM